jgi:hypothetical protein
MTLTALRTYEELIAIPRYKDRYEYLRLTGSVGLDTFGADRLLNQILYHSSEWQRFRHHVIVRDNGCDLAHPDFQIKGRIIIHHLNPLTVEQVKNRDPLIFDLNNVVCVSHQTHNAIHYGDETQIREEQIIERKPGDTKLW